MKYNNKWLTEKHQHAEQIDYLFFWGHKPAKDGTISKTCFSQWWIAPFEVNGIVYATAEHWMMAGKARLFGDEITLQQILASSTPAEAKNKGRLVKGFDANTWDQEKYRLVTDGNFHKFSAHVSLKAFLLSTGSKIIVEASPVDRIWGIGMAGDDPSVQNPLQWKGQNLLGYALMEVRDRLR